MKKLIFLPLLSLLACSTAHAGSTNQASPLEQLLSQMGQSTPDPKPSSLEGTISLTGIVDQSSVSQVIKEMDILKSSGATQIVLKISSGGGSVGAGQVLAQKIETLGIPVICIGDMHIESMAFYILQSCTERWSTKRTVFMAHPPSDHNVEGNPAQLEEEVQWMTALANSMAEHEAARLKISVKQFKNKIKHHAWYFNWQEALNVGAIDKVVEIKDIPPEIQWN